MMSEESKQQPVPATGSTAIADDVPAPWELMRASPRSLTRTLLKLREEGHWRTVEKMAEALGIGVRRLREWESDREPDKVLEVQHLQRYQDLLGIPIGIIVCISQILADARDGHEDRLQVMGRMLGYLHARLNEKEKWQEAIADVQQGKLANETTYAEWDNFLGILIMGVWGSVAYPLRRAFVNPGRLQKHIDVHEGRSRAHVERRRQHVETAGGSAGKTRVSTAAVKRKR